MRCPCIQSTGKVRVRHVLWKCRQVELGHFVFEDVDRTIALCARWLGCRRSSGDEASSWSCQGVPGVIAVGVERTGLKCGWVRSNRGLPRGLRSRTRLSSKDDNWSIASTDLCPVPDVSLPNCRKFFLRQFWNVVGTRCR